MTYTFESYAKALGLSNGAKDGVRAGLAAAGYTVGPELLTRKQMIAMDILSQFTDITRLHENDILYHIALAITHSSFDIKPDADWIVEITSGVKRIVPIILTAD